MSGSIGSLSLSIRSWITSSGKFMFIHIFCLHQERKKLLPCLQVIVAVAVLAYLLFWKLTWSILWAWLTRLLISIFLFSSIILLKQLLIFDLYVIKWIWRKCCKSLATMYFSVCIVLFILLILCLNDDERNILYVP